jgi:hypothetical protein
MSAFRGKSVDANVLFGLCVLIVMARVEHVTNVNLLAHGKTPERSNRLIHIMSTYNKPNTARREQRQLITDHTE